MKADLIIKNGLVYIADGNGSTAEAVAVCGNKIVYVGDEAGAADWAGEETRIIDMNGGMVLPGFIDSHQHAAFKVTGMFTLELHACADDHAYVEAIREYCEAHPELDAIVGAGWDRPCFNEVPLHKSTLDAICADRPVVMADAGFHVHWMNSKALEMMGIDADFEAPEGVTVEKDENGEPTGVVAEFLEVYEHFQKFTPEQFKEAILSYQEESHQYGITATFEDTPYDFDAMVEAYRQLEAEGSLKFRSSGYMRIDKGDDYEASVAKIKALREDFNSGLFRMDGGKLFIDGVLEGETAYMEAPYDNNPENYGEYQWEGATDDLNRTCRLLEEADLNYHFHTIGDKAVAVALDAIEYAKKDAENTVTRPGITHLQVVREQDFPRFKELGVSAVIQAFWAGYSEYYDQAVEFIGRERAESQFPIGSLFASGALVASGSDYPVQTNRPLLAIQMGITRAVPGDEMIMPKESEKVTLEDMLQSYTRNGAIANYLEDEIGTLEVGKKADMVILEKNLFEISPYEIVDVKEMMTIFDGNIVYER